MTLISTHTLHSDNETSSVQVKSFPSYTAHGAALISGPQPDTSLHCETTDTWVVYHVVCLFTPQPLGQRQIILLGNRGT